MGLYISQQLAHPHLFYSVASQNRGGDGCGGGGDGGGGGGGDGGGGDDGGGDGGDCGGGGSGGYPSRVQIVKPNRGRASKSYEKGETNTYSP